MMKRVHKADIVYGVQAGDESKGKVAAYLSSLSNPEKDKYYDFVARWGGGANAGHTVFVNSKKYKTHMIPSGVFHGIKSLVGPGCVVNLEGLKVELEYLEANGFDKSLVKIYPNTHIVSEEHINFDKNNLSKLLGTTSKGIAPAYSDKFARKGIQFHQVAEKDPFWKDYLFNEELHGNVLCEGAQGFFLDINWGNYPYVTSSETLPYAACSLGFSPKLINNIYAVAKIYETRSGEDPLFPESLFDNPELLKIADEGNEYGTTTGRRRKVNYLNLDRLIYALEKGGATHLIISKCDVLEKVGSFKLYYKNELISFESLSLMKDFIEDVIDGKFFDDLEFPLEKIYFSHSPEEVENLSGNKSN
jgi:adenylosuccinate synthase